MADIFVSYATEDRDRVRSLVEALQEQGWSVWWDRDIHAGPRFDQVIQEEIDKASCVVVIWTEASVASDWVRDEANEGREKKILVPVLFSDVRPPLGFRAAQTANLIDWPEQRGEINTLLNGVQALLGTPTSAGRDEQKSIAVLPFANMSNDPDNEYFSDGISEDILNSLVKTNTLPVIARTSSFQYKGQNLNVKKIASELNVTHVLEGSVRRVGNEVRITAQLADALTGVHLWSEHYDRELINIFALQDEIASKVVDQIGIALAVDKNSQSSLGTKNPEALELYLQAKHLANTGNPFEVEKAIPLYEQAVGLDNEFVDAWIDFGLTYIMLAELPLSFLIPAEVNPIAINAFKTALDIDPENSKAKGLLGWLLIAHEYRWTDGLKLMEQSIALNTQDAQVLTWYGFTLYLVDHPNAFTVLEKAHKLNPLDGLTVRNRAIAFILDGRNAEATVLIESSLIQNPQKYDANVLAALFNAMINRFDTAESCLVKAREIVGVDNLYVKRVEQMIAKGTGNLVLASELRIELLGLAKHRRVNGLWALAMDEDEEARLVEIIELAVSQRHVEILPFLFGVKPPRMPGRAWNRIQETTRVAEAKTRTLTLYGQRSEEEKTQLNSTAISLSAEELDLYVGVFEDPVARTQATIERDCTKLKGIFPTFRISLIPTGDNHFDGLEAKFEYDFTVENNQVTQLRWQGLQMTGVLIRKREY